MNQIPAKAFHYERQMELTRNWTLGLLLLTSIHHGLGAFIYAAPFRLHVVFVALPLAVLIAWLLRVARNRIRRGEGGYGIVLTTLVIVCLLILGIGWFEGAYNHVLKNILFFMRVSPHTMMTLFPPPTYEMPDNFLFEATGILQFPVSLFAAAAAIKLLKNKFPSYHIKVPSV
jgi:hypothetical protein